MLLRETIRKTKTRFLKTLQNLKSFFCRRYRKLAKFRSLNPFSSSHGGRKDYQRDQFYIKFFDELEASLGKAQESEKSSIVASEEPKKEEDGCGGSFVDTSKRSPEKRQQEGVVKEKKNRESPEMGKEEACSKNINGGGYELAQKIKDWEMMEAGDVEQALDVEEALHYYSRLTSPVYLDIVDKFFTDVYKEFTVPQVSPGMNSSKRRFDSITC